MPGILSIPLYTGRRCDAVSGGYRPVFSGTGIAIIFAMITQTLVLKHNRGEFMKKAIVLCALLVLGSVFASAQTTTPRVAKRQLKQQARIEQGVKSGELTAGETKRLELQQAKIQADKRKAKANGVVTPAERAKLAREQNRASRKIYRLKHNNNVAK